MVYHTS